jgi:tripartite-type tricarboxylate transporter receptor subunit TctC
VQRLNTSLLEPVSETIEETKAFIAAEVRKWAPIIRAAKIQM